MIWQQHTLGMGVSELHTSIEVSLTPCSPDVDTSWECKSPCPMIHVRRGLKLEAVESELRSLNVKGKAKLHLNS